MKRALALVILAAALVAATVALTQPAAPPAATKAFVEPVSPPPYTAQGPTQPINFSHQIHAGKLGMNCLYCHSSAEKSPIANIPAVSTCMGCHKIARADRPEIIKLTGYSDRGEQVPWVEVYALPAHVKFNHKRHVKAGIRCQDCHGPVETMAVVYQYPSLRMGWCVTCHRKNLDNPNFPASMDCLVCHH
jgi:hypothetical protein